LSIPIQRWLQERRDGVEQTPENIHAFVNAVVREEITSAQSAAWLAFVLTRGMTEKETLALTEAMTQSGTSLSWPGISGPFVDKHSTGGVGDKVSLALAPLWASLDFRVPMLSGRGLGITGGTLDKLESIPGYRTSVASEDLHRILADVGCFIVGQTEDIAPADRILYALRDETGTVPSIPLITASILSKKLVEGLDRLVLDVKYGTGAFMKTKKDAQDLADSLVAVGAGAGVETTAQLTPMMQPLGEAVGNALEVEEAVACLQGEGPQDFRDLVVALSGEGARAEAALDSGRAFEKWVAMVEAQGGQPCAPRKGGGCSEWVLESTADGTLSSCDAGLLGQAAFDLGAGRSRAGERVHFGVGLRVHAKVGDAVCVGQPLVTLVHDQKGLERAQELARSAFTFAS